MRRSNVIFPSSKVSDSINISFSVNTQSQRSFIDSQNIRQTVQHFESVFPSSAMFLMSQVISESQTLKSNEVRHSNSIVQSPTFLRSDGHTGKSNELQCSSTSVPSSRLRVSVDAPTQCPLAISDIICQTRPLRRSGSLFSFSLSIAQTFHLFSIKVDETDPLMVSLRKPQTHMNTSGAFAFSSAFHLNPDGWSPQ
jgi:hypothetical protein